MSTLEGYIIAFEIPPSMDDREGLCDLAESHFDLVILGDKSYAEILLWDDMKRQAVCLMSLKCSHL